MLFTQNEAQTPAMFSPKFYAAFQFISFVYFVLVAYGVTLFRHHFSLYLQYRVSVLRSSSFAYALYQTIRAATMKK